MARFFVACLLVSALCVGCILALGHLVDPSGSSGGRAPAPPVPVKKEPVAGGTQPKPAPVESRPAERPAPSATGGEDDNKPVTVLELSVPSSATPITILDARVTAVQQQNVPAERDGKLLFLGTEVEPGEYVPAEKLISFEITTLAIRVKDENEWAKLSARDQLKAFGTDGKIAWYRPVLDTDNLMESETALITRKLSFRSLDVGDEVRPGQMLGIINPVLALAEVSKQQQKVGASQAEVRSSERMKEEANRRWLRDLELSRKSKGTVSNDELAISKVTFEKYREEEAAKAAAVKMSQAELAATFTALRQHIVRASIPGVIRQTFKQPGEAVKNLDPVLQIQNPRMVRVDAQVDVQDALILRSRLAEAAKYRAEGRRLWMDALTRDPAAVEPVESRTLRQRADRLTSVEVEASRQEPPLAVLSGHRSEVTCVSVTREASPRIISGSEDSTVRIWTRLPGEDRWTEQKELTHYAPIRSLTVTGPKAERNLLFTGTAAGRGRIFDLDDLKTDAVMLKSRHTGPIRASAFSTDGSMCVTGGEDSSLCLWNTRNGELYGRIPNAHRAAVISVTFTSKNQVVSTGADKRLIVWNLFEGGEGGKTLKIDSSVARSGGEVATLGVDPTGEYAIIDEDKELRVQSLSGKRVIGALRNPAGMPGFGYFALFAPDGKTILTSGNAPGRLQLWRSPGESARTSEMRHYLWSGTATCGSFDPAGKFAVTGTQDNHILVWKMPDRLEVEKPLPGQLTFVEEFLDVNARKLAIRAAVVNPGWVIPGASATVVVPPVGRGQ